MRRWGQNFHDSRTRGCLGRETTRCHHRESANKYTHIFRKLNNRTTCRFCLVVRGPTSAYISSTVFTSSGRLQALLICCKQHCFKGVERCGIHQKDQLSRTRTLVKKVRCADVLNCFVSGALALTKLFNHLAMIPIPVVSQNSQKGRGRKG